MTRLGPITVVEGPDCSGKTSLIKAWTSADDELVVRHFGPPSRHGPWADYTEALADAEKNELGALIFDRFLYGELIYGPVLRNSHGIFTRAHARMLERVLLSYQGVLVLCLPPWEVVRELWEERQEDELVKKEAQLKTIYDSYQLLAELAHLPVVRYDMSVDDADQIRELVEAARPPANKGPGHGCFAPGVTLLVGEQLNPQTAISNWPFVANGESSLWLAQQLEDAKVKETQLYWVNALDKNGLELNPQFLRELRPRQVVAMGGAAKLWVKRHQHIFLSGTLIDEVPHPQFWKRFHSKQRYPLMDRLMT